MSVLRFHPCIVYGLAWNPGLGQVLIDDTRSKCQPTDQCVDDIIVYKCTSERCQGSTLMPSSEGIAGKVGAHDYGRLSIVHLYGLTFAVECQMLGKQGPCRCHYLPRRALMSTKTPRVRLRGPALQASIRHMGPIPLRSNMMQCYMECLEVSRYLPARHGFSCAGLPSKCNSTYFLTRAPAGAPQ